MYSSFLCNSFYPSFGADLLIALLGALFGLGTAYYIYLVSIWQIRKDRLKYVAALIEKIAPSLHRQAEYCNEYASLITKHPFSNEMLRLEANRDPKRLSDKADQEGVYHAYLWKYKRTDATYKDFQALYGYIDYADYLVDELIKTNENVQHFTWERKKKYQVLFKKTKELMQSLTLIPELANTQPGFIEFCNKLLIEFVANQPEGENLVESYTMVVQPLQEYIMTKAQPHPKITELLFLTQDLFTEYNGIELSARHNAFDYRDFATSLEKAAKALLDTSGQLRTDFRS
jgi:hypothetical protein